MLIAGVVVVLLLAGGVGAYLRLSDQDGEVVDPAYFASAHAVCALLSKEDLDIALGARYRDGRAPILRTLPFADLVGVTKCAYTRIDQAEGAQGAEVGVVYAYGEQIFEQARMAYERQAVGGVGRKAFWYPQAGELLVLTKDKIVGIYVPVAAGEPKEDSRERARRIAAKAVARLDQRPGPKVAAGASSE